MVPRFLASTPLAPRPLGKSGILLSPIGLGSFKIGRNQGAKYARPYDLPTDSQVRDLIRGALDLGVNYIDTAPAYGSSEERLGQALAGCSEQVILSTKVGETFEHGRSTYDFSAPAIGASVERSLKRLGRTCLDIVFIHSDGRDVEIMQSTDAVPTLQDLKKQGLIRAIGLSGKTIAGGRAALAWADALMVEYHPLDASHADLIAEAQQAGVGVVVKKGLASGKLDPARAIPFILQTPGVTSMVIGGLNLDHLRQNISFANLPQS